MKNKLAILLLVNAFTLAATILVTFSYDRIYKKSLISFISISQHNNIFLKDYSAMTAELAALKGIFHKVQINSEGSLSTILDSKINNPSFTLSLSSEIKFNSTEANSYASITYSYNGWPIILSGVLIWIILSIFINPAFLFLLSHLEKVRSNEIELVNNKALSELARQVAHDIRAPLSAMNAISIKLKNSNPFETELLVKVSNRINGIAEDLLNRTRDNLELKTPHNLNTLIQPIPLLVNIIQEKKLILEKNISIQIHSEIDENQYCVGKVKEFESILSNIIQNSIDAKVSDKPLLINVNAKLVNKFLEISIADNGRGIPEKNIKYVGTLGFSYGKAHNMNGNGLGIYNARKAIESWGGKINISSVEGYETTVSISLPCSSKK